MKKRGRPIRSKIRERMQQIVDALGVSYGYEIYKVYNTAFEKIELRSMYYHLSKGVRLLEFQEIGIKNEKGKFTWGDVSTRKYYIPGPLMRHRATTNLHIIIKTLGFEYKEPKTFVNWQDVSKEKLVFLKNKFEKLKKEFTRREEEKNVFNEYLEELDKVINWLNGKSNIHGFLVLKKEVQGFLNK